MDQVHLIVLGQSPRKSNSRRIVSRGRGGKAMLIKSEEALAYVDSFVRQVPYNKRKGLGGKDKPLVVDGDIYYKWQFRGDLSDELILDCLTKSGVIKDDRYVVKKTWRKRRSIQNPRVELSVKEIDDWEWA